MKNIIKYIILVILSLVFLGFTIYAYIYVHYSDKGNGEIYSYYSDIVFNNIVVLNDNMNIKVNEDDNSLYYEVPNISKNIEYSFSVDINNIGNKNISLNDISYENIDTNIDNNDLIIETITNDDIVIKGGEIKKVNIVLKYTGDNVEGLYYKMNIKFVFSK